MIFYELYFLIRDSLKTKMKGAGSVTSLVTKLLAMGLSENPHLGAVVLMDSQIVGANTLLYQYNWLEQFP